MFNVGGAGSVTESASVASSILLRRSEGLEPRVERRDGAAGRRETRGNEIRLYSSARPGRGEGGHVYDAPVGAIGGEWAGLSVPSSAPAGAGLFESHHFHGFRSPAATSTRGYTPWPLSGPGELRPFDFAPGSRSAPWVMRPTVIRQTLEGFHPSGRPRTPTNRNATLPGLRSDGGHGFPGCAARPRAVVWNRVAVRTIDAYILARSAEPHRSLGRKGRRAGFRTRRLASSARYVSAHSASTRCMSAHSVSTRCASARHASACYVSSARNASSSR